MASADFLTRIPTSRNAGSTRARVRISPGMTHPPSRLYLSDLRHGVPCKFRALTIMAALPSRAASYPLPVRQASALPSASSRFAVTRDTLAVRLTLPLAGRVEDFHLQVSAPCRAHHQKAPPIQTGGAPNTTAYWSIFSWSLVSSWLITSSALLPPRSLNDCPSNRMV